MSVTEASGVSTTWDDSTVVEGEIDSVDSAIRAWLNQRGAVDLESLGKAELRQLIQFLKALPASEFKESTAYNNLLNTLGQIQQNWKLSGSDTLGNALTNAQQNTNFLRALANATDGADNLDLAIDQSLALVAELREINNWLYSAADVMTGNPSAEVAEILNSIQSLREMGFTEEQLGSMGLLQLEQGLREADKVYQKVLAEKNDPTLAESALRLEVASLKVAHAEAMGISENDPRLKELRNTQEGETIWHTNLTTPWEEYDPAVSIQEFTPEGLRKMQAEYLRHLELIPPGPDGDKARVYLETKLTHINRAIATYSDSRESIGPALSFTFDMRMADSLRLEDLIEQAKKTDNPELVSELQSKKDKLDSVIAAISDAMRSVLDSLGSFYLGLSR